MRTYESLKVENNLEQSFLRGYLIRMNTIKSKNENLSFIISFTRRLMFVERIRRNKHFLNNPIIEELPLIMLKNNDGSFSIEIWYDELEFYI